MQYDIAFVCLILLVKDVICVRGKIYYVSSVFNICIGVLSLNQVDLLKGKQYSLLTFFGKSSTFLAASN